MLKLLNLEPEDYCDEARNILKAFCDIEERTMDREALLNNIQNYDVVITRLGHKFDAPVLTSAKNLKAIVTATTGLNHIDVDTAEKNGQAVLSLRGETAFLETVTATAEHTFALLLALCRCLCPAASHVKKGGWNRDLFKGVELKNKILGIYGYGRLGKIVASYGHAFSMRVWAFDNNKDAFKSAPSYVSVVSKDELLEASDFLSLHVLFTEENRDIMDQDAFHKMKQGAYLINTARGELVNEDALMQALESGHLAGAALDVIKAENENSANISNSSLVKYAENHDNLIITPHIGGATYDSMRNTEVFMAEKLKNWAIGQGIV